MMHSSSRSASLKPNDAFILEAGKPEQGLDMCLIRCWLLDSAHLVLDFDHRLHDSIHLHPILAVFCSNRV
uniref:Uncharacterized protein n=1 Tax=Arundo donax TaxID=35708 RepID=A0A0A9AT67_ARUDO